MTESGIGPGGGPGDGAGGGAGDGSRVDPGRGVYGISVAAELVGMDPQSLRLYERRGLLEPGRTAGGTRRYSADDLRRLERIGELLADGLNLAGIALVLRLQADNDQLQSDKDQLQADNARLRDRNAQLRADLAEASGSDDERPPSV